jgi:hypothetical protein
MCQALCTRRARTDADMRPVMLVYNSSIVYVLVAGYACTLNIAVQNTSGPSLELLQEGTVGPWLSIVGPVPSFYRQPIDRARCGKAAH